MAIVQPPGGVTILPAEIAPQIEYRPRETDPPKYRPLQVPLNNQPSNTVTIQQSSTTLLEFKITTPVYNLSRTYISYSEEIPAQGAGGNKFSWTHEDVAKGFSAITFGSAGGNDLVNLQYANNFSKHAWKLNTPQEQMMANSQIDGLYKCNKASVTNIVPGGANGAYKGFDNYIEPTYSVVSGDNGSQYITRRIPLGMFAGTLFAVDRDFYSPVELYLRIWMGSGDKMAYFGTANNDPTTGAATLSGQMSLKNVYLYLAVEENPGIVQSIRDLYNAGKYSFQIPFTMAYKTPSVGAGSQISISIPLLTQYGRRVKRIRHTVWDPQETLDKAYDTNNLNGAKIVSYQTFLDSRPLQDRVLDCRNPDEASNRSGDEDWLENKKFCGKNSSITSRECYKTNWFHQDQMFEPNKNNPLPDYMLDEGILMVRPMNWQFSATTAAAQANLMHYTWVEYIRTVHVTQDGPKFIDSGVVLI